MRQRPHISALYWISFIVLCTAFWPSLAAAQTSATLRGIVTSADDGGVLPNANVVLSSMADEVVRATATNIDGYFEIRGISPGRYRLRISYVGLNTHEDTLDLRAERRQYNVALDTQQQSLEEVQVVAEGGATHREAGLQAVGASDLERIPTPGPGGDLASYLQSLPGVVSAGSRGGQVHVRGGTASQNLVLVDGLPITQPFHISSFYSAFPQETVKNVDLYAGGFGAEYLGSTSSVLDITLRRGNMHQFVGSASMSPFITSARIEGPIDSGRKSFLAVVRRSTIEEVGAPLLGRTVPLRFYDLTGRYSLQRESATCNITGVHTYDEGRINLNRNTALSWSNTTVGGRCLAFGEEIDHALDVSGGFTSFRNSAGTSGSPERSARFWKGYVSIKREQDVPWGTLDLGTQWSLSRYGYELGSKFVALEVADQFNGSLRGYAKTTWHLSERLAVTPSFGTQFSGHTGAPTYEPRLRLSFQPDGTDRQEINMAAGKYHQLEEGLTDKRDAGTVFTVWTPDFAKDQLPQALHGILGYRQRIGSGFEVSVEGYAKDLENIPVPKWTPVARFSTELTVADGVAYGADLRTTLEINPFYLFVGYGWSNVTYRAGRDNLGAWIQDEIFEYSPSHDRRHQVNAIASYEVAGFTANVGWEFGSGRPYTQVYGFDLALQMATLDDYPTTDPGTALTYFGRPYGARLPTYHRLDMSLSRSFDVSSRLSLETEAGAINVYDRRNVFYYDINTIERVDQTPILPYVSLRVLVE